MITNNVDLAAYLVLRGLEPSSIVIGRKNYRTYEFPDEQALTLAKAFWDDAIVPVRTFVLARSELRRLEERVPTVRREEL